MFIPRALGSVNASDDTLRVSVPKIMPYTLRIPVPGGYLLDGPIPNMMEIISRATKTKLLIVNKNESHWGGKVNGSYTGFFGLVARGETDIFVGPMMPTAERMEIGDHTPPHLFTEIHLMTPKPGKYVDPFGFVSSFPLEVWFGLLVSMVVISTMFSVDLCVREKNTNNMTGKLGSSIWLSCTYFFTAAKHEKVTKLSTRILLGSWSLFLFIIVTALSSCLVSTMLVQDIEDHVDTLADVLRFPKLKIIVEKGSGFEQVIMRPKTLLYKKVQRHVVYVLGSYSPGAVQDEVFDRVEAGGHLVLHERLFQDAVLAARYAKRGHCRFRRARESLFLQPVVMLMRKSQKPEIKHAIHANLRRALEMGISERPIQPYLFNSSRCYAEEPQEAAAYCLEDMQGAFLALALGLALSLGVFLAEMTVNNSRTFKLKQGNLRRPRRAKM